MKESKLFDTLLPSSLDFQPIIKSIRDKFNLPEISPDDDPITEIYLGDEQIPLEDFRQEIKSLVEKIPDHLPPEISRILTQAKSFAGKPLDMREIESCPENFKNALVQFYTMAQSLGASAIKILDYFDYALADMLYVYLLTGESEEISSDWLSKVLTISVFGEPVVFAGATQFANPEVIVQQFREEYKKTFGFHRPKITETMVTTAYYLQLKRMGRPWKFIVEEYIRRNHFSLPRDQNSKRYAEVWKMYSDRLKKRIQRTEIVLDVLLRDKI